MIEELISKVKLPAVIVNEQFMIRTANDAFSLLTGVNHEELVNKSLLEFISIHESRVDAPFLDFLSARRSIRLKATDQTSEFIVMHNPLLTSGTEKTWMILFTNPGSEKSRRSLKEDV